MAGLRKTVFPGNNSSRGFYSFYESGLAGMERVFILKGGPGTGKSTLIKSLAEDFREKGFDVELWQCSSDPHSFDGVKIPAKRTAVIDGTSPHCLDPVYPGVKEDIVDLGVYWDGGILQKSKEKIMTLTDDISESFREAYVHLREAGEADSALRSLRREIFPEEKDIAAFMKELFGEKKSDVRHLFAAAVTPDGLTDLTFPLCADVSHRWFLQGKRGRGQQEYLKAVIEEGNCRRLSMDIFHGALDPEEILLVCFPEEDLAVASVESIPSEYVKAGDRVLSFCGETRIDPEEKAMETEKAEALNRGVEALARAHSLHDELERFYGDAMDFTALEGVRKNIFQKISDFTPKE